MYGGIGMLNAPLNDAWILTINEDLSIQWNPYHLSYDHGEVRAWHGACYVNHEIFIHSGTTQEFYSNRLELDDHAESVLTFEFGVKSLLLLCVESIENAYDSNSTNPILEEILPLNLKSMLVSRSLFNEGTKYQTSRPMLEKPKMFTQSIINVGL